jgi:hypothetical protein
MDGSRMCVLKRRVWAVRELEAEGLWEMVGVVATGGAGRGEVLRAACGGDAGVATGTSVCACPVRSEGTLRGKSQNTCSAAPSSTDGSSGSGPACSKIHCPNTLMSFIDDDGVWILPLEVLR